MKSLVVEAVGSLLLVFIVALSSTSPHAALAIGLGLMALIYIGGHESGGHYNPAVTIAQLLRGRIALNNAIFYIISQLVGVFVGAILIRYVIAKPWAPAMGDGVTMINAIIIEALLTAIFVGVILAITTTRRFMGNVIGGFAIGLTLTSIIIAGGALSGGVFNPAIGVSTHLYAHILNGSGTALPYIVYTLGPVIGAFLGAFFINYIED